MVLYDNSPPPPRREEHVSPDPGLVDRCVHRVQTPIIRVIRWRVICEGSGRPQSPELWTFELPRLFGFRPKHTWACITTPPPQLQFRMGGLYMPTWFDFFSANPGSGKSLSSCVISTQHSRIRPKGDAEVQAGAAPETANRTGFDLDQSTSPQSNLGEIWGNDQTPGRGGI